jgi:hypothetical protein
MLCYLPVPYENEILYGVIARYMVHNDAKRAVSEHAQDGNSGVAASQTLNDPVREAKASDETIETPLYALDSASLVASPAKKKARKD